MGSWYYPKVDSLESELELPVECDELLDRDSSAVLVDEDVLADLLDDELLDTDFDELDDVELDDVLTDCVLDVLLVLLVLVLALVSVEVVSDETDFEEVEVDADRLVEVLDEVIVCVDCEDELIETVEEIELDDGEDVEDEDHDASAVDEDEVDEEVSSSSIHCHTRSPLLGTGDGPTGPLGSAASSQIVIALLVPSVAMSCKTNR